MIAQSYNNRVKYRVRQHLFFEMRHMWQAAAWIRWTGHLPRSTFLLSVT